jgi:hypothetical protein
VSLPKAFASTILLSVSLLTAGCSTSLSQSSSGAPPPPRPFHGFAEVQGQSKDNGPFVMNCSIRDERMRCRVFYPDKSLSVDVAYDGDRDMMCVHHPKLFMPLRFRLRDIVSFIQWLPPTFRRDYIAPLQPTGRSFTIANRTCNEFASRPPKGGMQSTCIDQQRFIIGIDRVRPLAAALGIPPEPHGIGMASEDRDEKGEVTHVQHVTRIDEGNPDPRLFTDC